MTDPAPSSGRRTLRVVPRNAHSPTWRRRLNLAFVVLVVCAVAWPALNPFTAHPGETVILLMPPAFGAFLWFGWPRVRRTPWWKYALYLAMLTPILAAAEYFVAFVAGGRVLPIEVFWALYFAVGLRLAWTVWTWTVGRLGEGYRRWGRRARTTGYKGQVTGNSRRQRRLLARTTMLIMPGRVALTLFAFVPLALGFAVHRIKIGNRTGPQARGNLPVEEVAFRTADGLLLSGWFLPDRDSDSTVVICHGSGANKSNFVDFMRVFRFQGYNSLIFDFRGHGASEGHTCTFGLFEQADVRAAVDWLRSQRPDRARHVYGLGSSMGAMALALEAAHDQRIEAVVLDSCFASAPLLLHQQLGRIPLIGPVMATLISAAASLQAGASLCQVDARPAVAALSPRPILFIHGIDDKMIPPVNMEILFACAKEPKDKWLGPGPHSNIMTADFAEYQRRVIAFLNAASYERADGKGLVVAVTSPLRSRGSPAAWTDAPASGTVRSGTSGSQ